MPWVGMNDCIALVLCGLRVLKKSGKTAIKAMTMRTTPLTSASRCFLKRHHTSFQFGATSNASSSRNVSSLIVVDVDPIEVVGLGGDFAGFITIQLSSILIRGSSHASKISEIKVPIIASIIYMRMMVPAKYIS